MNSLMSDSKMYKDIKEGYSDVIENDIMEPFFRYLNKLHSVTDEGDRELTHINYMLSNHEKELKEALTPEDYNLIKATHETLFKHSGRLTKIELTARKNIEYIHNSEKYYYI